MMDDGRWLTDNGERQITIPHPEHSAQVSYKQACDEAFLNI